MSDGVLVVGGGITGLSAAYDLACAGVPVTVVERSGRWGGKVHTDVIDGFVVEAGPDSFVAYRPAAARLATDLGIGEQIVTTLEPRQVWLRRDGRMVPLPDEMGVVLPTRLAPFVRTPVFTWPQKVRAGLDLIIPRTLDDDDIAVGEFLRRRLGDALVTQLADPLFGGIYGTTVDQLSLDAVLPSLREAERTHRSLLLASLAQGRAARAARATRGADAPTGQSGRPGSPFRSLRHGMGSLVDALVAALDADGRASLRLGTEVTALRTRGTTTLASLDDGSTLSCDGVVLTAPGPITARLLREEVPAAAAAVGSVRHATTAVVSLGFPADAFDQPLPGHGFLEAGPSPAVFSGCTISSNKWPERAPPGTVLLRAFVPDRSASLLREDDATLADIVTAQVAEVLAARVEPLMRCVARWSEAMPVYTTGHLERMAATEAAMNDQPTWILAGATYRGVGVPDCIAAGRAAAAQLVVELG